jgi:hypothetical protein
MNLRLQANTPDPSIVDRNLRRLEEAGSIVAEHHPTRADFHRLTIVVDYRISIETCRKWQGYHEDRSLPIGRFRELNGSVHREAEMPNEYSDTSDDKQKQDARRAKCETQVVSMRGT